MMLLRAALLLGLLSRAYAEAESTTSTQASAATTLGTLFRQARSEHYYASSGAASSSRYASDDSLPRSDALEHRDSAYFESRCITCDPSKAAAGASAAAVAPSDRDPYAAGRWRQRPKYDYYDDEYDDRRYRDRYDYYDRARAPAVDPDRYDPYGRNELFRPYNERYDYERDRYYTRPERPIDRPLDDRPLIERPINRPVDRPLVDRPYERGYERGNGYDNLDPRYPYDQYDRYGPPRRPAYDEYGPPQRYDRFNGRNYGRYDPRYDRYDRYDERNGYGRRPVYDDRYDDRYDRYGSGGGGRLPPPDSRGYYGGGAGAGGWPAPGAADRPAYASAWNYAGGSRDSWRDVNRDRDRDRDRERDRDGGFYRPRDYFYDATAAPGGSRPTSFLYDRPESSTKPDQADQRDKPTNSPQTQDSGKTYKD